MACGCCEKSDVYTATCPPHLIFYPVSFDVLAAVLEGPRMLFVREVAVPRVEGYAIVRSELVGICGTDKAFYVGTYPLFKRPLVPGHEVVGVVVEGPPHLVGRRVVSEINFPDWSCDYCRSGLYTHCPYKRTLGIDFDGGMAEFFAAPPTALHVFDGPPELGIFVEPLAAVLNAFAIRPIRPGDRVAVIGTGNLAQLAAQAARVLGASRVDGVVRRGSKKAAVLAKFVDAVVEEPAESSYDVVFEASGDPSALELAVRLAKPRGVVHLKSTPGLPATFNATYFVVKEVAVVGSRCGTFREFREAIRLLLSGAVKPTLDAVFPLAEAREAFEYAVEKSPTKVAVRVS